MNIKGKDSQLSNKDVNKNSILNNTKEQNALENLVIKVLRRKKILIITFILFTVFGFIRTTKEKIFNPLYQGSFAILIKDPINQNNRNPVSDGISSVFDTSSLSLEQDIPTLRKLLLSQFILEDISRKYNTNYIDLSKRIKIEQDFDAQGILEVLLVSKSTKKDLPLLKDLSKVYVNFASLQKQKKLSDGLSFLSAQEPAIKQKNIELRLKLENFMKLNNLVDPIVESQNKKDEIKSFELEIAALETKIKRLNNIKQNVLEGNLSTTRYSEIIGDKQNSALELGDSEEGVSKEYENLNEQLAKAQLIYTPNSSLVRNFTSRLEILKPKLKETQLEGIDKAINSTQDMIELKKIIVVQLNKDFKKLTSLIREYEVLNFDLLAATENLTGLNKVKEKLQLEIAQDSQPWTIIRDPNFNPVRIYPSYSKELTNFALTGIFIGIILVLIRDKFDDVFHSPGEIKQEMNFPFLGHIPYVEHFSKVREERSSILEAFKKDSNNESANSYERFFYQEALRNIYTSIRFMDSEQSIKVITISSSIPKEGKSLSSILLAKTLSEMDLRILQIDADLRKPQLHLRLGLNNITGLSNIITNQELKTADAIQKVPGFKNWNVITSGTRPPDPSRLLKSEKMDNILNELRKDEKYDLILIDTPPIIGLSDALLVSEKADGSILVITTNQVKKALPIESISKTLESGSYFIGIISNSTRKVADQLLSNYGYGDYNYSYTYNEYVDEDSDTNKDTKNYSKIQKIKNSVLTNSSVIIRKFFKWLDY